MNLKIRSGTAGYNNKILVSDGNFSLGKIENVNLMTPAIKNHKANSIETPAMKSTQTVVNSEEQLTWNKWLSLMGSVARRLQAHRAHEDEKIALVLSLTGIFMIGSFLDES